jgi:hypothetical protein
MKILALGKLREGVTGEMLEQYRTAEVRAIWDLYVQGFCREIYAVTNQVGSFALVLESESVEAAREAFAVLPFVQLHLLDFDLFPLGPFRFFTRLFQVEGSNQEEEAKSRRLKG